MKRRTLLLSGAAAGGALLVGWGALPPRSRLGAKALLPVQGGEVALNGWIKVRPDGDVVLAMARSEMGQGVHTALPMLVAEELDLPLGRVHIEQAGFDAIYGNVAAFVGTLPLHPQDIEPGHETTVARASQWMVAKLARELGINMTGGSSSMADAWEPLRMAAATARAQLVGAASLAWRLPKQEIGVRDGVMSHPSGVQAHFGSFAAEAAGTPAGDVQLKPREQWTLIGRRTPRNDSAGKADGSAVFGIDARPAVASAAAPASAADAPAPPSGLLFAAARMCPMLGGAPQRIANVDAVLAQPGVLRLVRLLPLAGATSGVAIVATNTWLARRAVEALDIDWSPPPAGVLQLGAIRRGLDAAAARALAGDGGTAFRTVGDVAPVEREARDKANGTRLIEAQYSAPYLAHATLEPMNCTAQVADGKVRVWAPTQVPGFARAAAARAAGVPEHAVDVHVTLLGGGFGRRLETDVIAQAVTIATETGGRPVQLLWSREEDMTHDVYRPAGVALCRAVLGADGMPLALHIASAGDAITPRWMERNLPALAGPIDTPDKTAAEGLIDLPYAVPHQRMVHASTRSGVPVGYWRAVGHSHNAFFSECFIDELAQAAGKNPLDYRLALLADTPRHAAVLRLAADKAGWGQPLPAGHARGLALHDSFGSIVAQVAEVSIDGGKTVKLHRVVCAVDCGTVINPAIVEQQMESGIVFGLSAALHGGIGIDGSRVQQRNFDSQPVLRMAETPRIDVHIVESVRPPTGVGEPGLPPIAPAVANALAVLTGKRQRSLPLSV